MANNSLDRIVTRTLLRGAGLLLLLVAALLFVGQAQGSTRAPVPSPVMAAHDGTSPLFGPPCWSRAKRNPATCTPTPTAFPTDTATITPTPTNTPIPPPPTNTPVVVPSATPLPSATPTPGVEPWRNPSPAVLAEEETMRQLINAHRVANGQHALLHVPVFDLAQRWWAYEMVTTNNCYHGDYGGRAYSLGYTGFAWGEAGACGYPNAAEALQGWLDSPGHRGIVEAVTMTEFGVGAWQYPNGYWQHWLLVGCDSVIPCLAGVEPRGKSAEMPIPIYPIIYDGGQR